ncbi:MAG: DUF1330 domain-containing protein [Gammaproteobacteria bacterium]|jgi:uncharacterized protein (DUF1330 family)|nr:DUF1330 domain-containing protein [Gammaproteobacteria bacterium]MBT4492175.1 DUF1330 domain-containing protein [Gammaproteobacteria bacterium]MBT7369691.1 DUF1330 domain-containing protein [Gammaproteobacteria bacterium]
MVKNILQPTGDQVRAFRDRATGEPISMLNLLKFKDKAEYEDGRECNLSGREAYQLYGEGFSEVMEPKGCRIIYSGEVRGFLIGEGEGAWDAIAVIEYPSTQIMLDMFRDEDYQKVQVHRVAALEGQMLIECGPGFSFS